jgi:hypothetical protein
VATGDVPAVAEVLAARYDVDPAVLLGDLDAFAGTLRDGGWWEPDTVPGPG